MPHTFTLQSTIFKITIFTINLILQLQFLKLNSFLLNLNFFYKKFISINAYFRTQLYLFIHYERMI